MWTISIVGVLMALLASDCLSQDRPQATGTIQGTVFTSQSDGGHAAVPHATIRLAGPATRETQSDDQGAYVFESLTPGSCVITTTAPGLTGTTNVVVKPGGMSAIPLQVSVETVKSTVTVTASAEPTPSESSAQSVTINTSVVDNSPNKNERFEDLLPLVPGVVRGPDGRLNLKGASSTQAGWLVNSANVTRLRGESERLAENRMTQDLVLVSARRPAPAPSYRAQADLLQAQLAYLLPRAELEQAVGRTPFSPGSFCLRGIQGE